VEIAAACGGSKAGDAAAAGDLKVALLTPGPISDRSWNGGAYDGLMRIKDSLGASVSHIQTKSPAEFDENFRQYGAGGYSLVFGHGFEFQDAAQRVAPQYPKTIYVTTGGTTASANMASMKLAFDEPSYLAGMVAGAVTKSGTVGCIGGTELPPVKSAFDAFTAGVHAVNPKATVLISYIGNWDDASAGKEQALAQAGRGADIIFQDADAAGLGVFQAAKESSKLFVIGSNSDQNAIAPTVTLGSVVIDIPHAFLRVAKEVKAGGFVGRVISLDTKSDVVRWVANPALIGQVPAPTAQRIDSVRAAMVAGTFVLPASK
jgi:basic membrane lipoprotein Med (substrate-binding protein (PBP1-ABC) superfamily)